MILLGGPFLRAEPRSLTEQNTLMEAGLNAFESKNYSVAASNLEKLNNLYPSAAKSVKIQHALGKSLVEAGAFKKAIPILRSALILSSKEKSPKEPIQLLLSEAFQKNNQPLEALAVLNEILKQPTLGNQPHIKDSIALIKARALLDQGKLEPAKQVLNAEIANKKNLEFEIEQVRFLIGIKDCEYQATQLSRDASKLHLSELPSLRLCFLSTLTLNHSLVSQKEKRRWCSALVAISKKLPKIPNDPSPQNDWKQHETSIRLRAYEKDPELVGCYAQ